jgi:hypothetical protein
MRVMWLCEEFGPEYEVVAADFDAEYLHRGARSRARRPAVPARRGAYWQRLSERPGYVAAIAHDA